MEESSTGKTIGRNVKTLRDAALLTQEEAAEKMGISPSQYNLLENGKVKRPHPRTLKKIGDFFGVAPQVLRNPEGILSPKALAPLTTEWAISSQDEVFQRRIVEASTKDLRGLIKGLVGNQDSQTLEGLKKGLREEQGSTGPVERVKVFERARRIREELLRRGDESPEEYLRYLRSHLDALGFE